MPVHQVERSLGRLDHGELRPAGFSPLASERDLVTRAERPARENQVAVASALEPHVELIEVSRRMERLAEFPGLVVVPRSRDVTVDLLQADHVGVLGLDDLDDPLEAVATIATADPLMNVVAQ